MANKKKEKAIVFKPSEKGTLGDPIEKDSSELKMDPGAFGEGFESGPVEASVAEDEEEQVVFRKDFDLGVNFYEIGDGSEIRVKFAEGKKWVADILEPFAIKTTKEGGKHYKVELFYKQGEEPYRQMDSLHGKTIALITGKDEKTGKSVGKVFENLRCVARFYDSIEGYPNIKFVKYICSTPPVQHWRGFLPGETYNIKWAGVASSEDLRAS